MALSLSALLDQLQPASWRGIEFHIPTTSTATGRRVQTILFPGLDGAVHSDTGPLDGDISVNGIIVGDDYVQRAQQLREAFRQRGPGTLVHPWEGELELVLVDTPALAYDVKQLRLVTFSATFRFALVAPEPQPDTLGLLLTQIEAVKRALRNTLREALAPVRLAFGAVAAVAGFGLWLKGSFTTLFGQVTDGGLLLAQLGTPFAGLTGLGALPADTSYGGAVADALQAVPDAAADAGQPAASPAIGTNSAETSVVLDPAAIAGAMLTAAGWTGEAAAAQPAAVTVVAQVHATLAAIAAGARIDFASRQEALAWRDRLDTAIGGCMASVVTVAGDAPHASRDLMQSLQALRSALSRDLSAEAGRLPSVRVITVPGATTVWHVAYHLAQGDAALTRALVDDLVARNGLRRAGALTEGTALEYLA